LQYGGNTVYIFRQDTERKDHRNGRDSQEKNAEWSKSAVFDGDPLTFFDAAPPDDAWAGIEPDKPAQVSEIEYIFRNDDNSIREGDRYELFYFSSDGRHPSGTRDGFRNGIFTFDSVPDNALFLLHNYTRGQEERIFTFENGKQVWW
jgi:hypothetical protein